MKISVVITKNTNSLNMFENIMLKGYKPDNVIFYSKNIDVEALYDAKSLKEILNKDGFNIIEQKPNYPYEHFRGAIIISNS